MKLTAFGIVLSMLLLHLTAVSQVSITTPGAGGAYSQNFDGAFLGTFNYNLNNNAPENLGWYSLRESGVTINPNTFNASIGILPVGQFYNYGELLDADRAFGSVATGGTSDMFYGLRFQNDTGSTIQSVRLQYTGEQWRTFFPLEQTLVFGYQVSALDITSLNALTFTPVPALDFTTPVNTFAGALNGNLPENRVTFDQTFVVAIAPGSEIMLRWEHVPVAALIGHGLAIDDVIVTFSIFGPTAAPVSISGRAMTASGVGIGNATLVVSGGTLTSPLMARTNRVRLLPDRRCSSRN